MLRGYHRHHEVNKDISAVWDEIRSFAETSSISKHAEELWSFTFSYSKSRYLRLTLATIKGQVSSKGDNLTIIDIKSNSLISTRLSLVGFIIMIILVNNLGDRSLSIFLKVLLMIGFVLGIAFFHNHESRTSISELEHKLNISRQ